MFVPGHKQLSFRSAPPQLTSAALRLRSLLNSADLPTFGRPMIVTCLQHIQCKHMDLQTQELEYQAVATCPGCYAAGHLLWYGIVTQRRCRCSAAQDTLGSSKSSWRRLLEESSLPSAQQLLMFFLLAVAHGPWASRPAAACGSPLLLAPPAAEPAACRLRALMRHAT